LEDEGIVSISSVDTRAITLILREAGVMRGGIFSGDSVALDEAEQLKRVREIPDMAGQNLSDQVSVSEMRVVPALGDPLGRLAVIDLGVKESTLHHLAARGFDVHVLPSTATYGDVTSLEPVALFYSNGPGDPSASDHHVALLQSALGARLPFFGICFGNQLLGRALGFDTYKLKY
jgi:carbamoyl-phosphate synthase small subunit